MSTVNLGRVQGGGIFYSTASSGTSIAKSTITPTSIVPLVGDCVMFPNGDLRKITAVGDTNVTCGSVAANFKGDTGEGIEALLNGTKIAKKATQDGDGNVIADTYAKQNGSYPNMTVGNATNAQKLGNVDVSQYAQITGMYPNMTVGNAQFANSLANKLYVRQSTIGWYKIAEFTVTGSNYNAFSVIILVNGVYGSRTSGNPEESGLLEVDIRKDPNGINASGSSLSILAGNLRADRFAFNTSGNLLSLYWYQDYEYASVNFTVLDSKSENDDECSYELRLGSFSSTLDNATYASNVVNAANDSLGNSIKDSYINKWEMANAPVNGSLIWGSGWIDFKRSGNVCICTFEISAPSTVEAWTNRKIANYPSGYSNGYGTVVGAGQMDSVDNMVPVTIYSQPDGIYINGKAHTIDSNRQVCGFVVWLTGHLKE